METIANTEYQEVYRVTDGVLLVINKFKKMYPNEYIHVSHWGAERNGKRKHYNKNTKDLYVQQFDEVTWSGKEVPKNTILYYSEPVVASENKYDWTYQIKTSGDSFSGNANSIENMLSDILFAVRAGGVRRK